MAFTTDTLKDLGLSEEQVKGVMKYHGEDLNEQKAKLNDLTAERDGLKTQLTDYANKLDEAQKSAENGSELAKQLEELKKSSEQAKTDYENNLKQTKLGYEIDNALVKAGALNTKATKALVDLDKVSFDDKGQLIGLNEQLENVKADNAFLFKNEAPQEEKKPAVNITAGGNPSSNVTSVPDVNKMTYKERLQFKQSDPDGYAQATKEN